jgi:serine protease inhibitor
MPETHYEATGQELRELVTAYNRLGFKLLVGLSDSCADENVLLSPMSVASSLSLLYHGCSGNTRQAIADVLSPGGVDGAALSRVSAALLPLFSELDPQAQIVMAFSLWADKAISFSPDFLRLADKFYKAEAACVDMRDPRTADVINRWASEWTGGKLDRLLDENDLRAATDIILTNVVYFKGLWTTPFDRRATAGGDFHLPGGGSTRVPLMSQRIECLYFQGEDFRALGLDYEGGHFSMYVFLPDENSNLKIFLGKLNEVNWARWLAGFDDAQAEISLPRLELTSEHDLREVLNRLGMGVAFSAEADFSPMTSGQHFISKFKHKAVVEVNEEGTEAAAATSVLMTRSITTPITFVGNRPFFWAIQDNQHGAILFAGVVVEPG